MEVAKKILDLPWARRLAIAAVLLSPTLDSADALAGNALNTPDQKQTQNCQFDDYEKNLLQIAERGIQKAAATGDSETLESAKKLRKEILANCDSGAKQNHAITPAFAERSETPLGKAQTISAGDETWQYADKPQAPEKMRAAEFAAFTNKEIQAFHGTEISYHEQISDAILEAETLLREKNSGEPIFDRHDILATIMIESDYKPEAGSGQAYGLMQLTPVNFERRFPGQDIFDIRLNILAGGQHLLETYNTIKDAAERRGIKLGKAELKQLTFGAYNAGPGAIIERDFVIPRFRQTLQNYFGIQHYADSFRKGTTSKENPLTGEETIKKLRQYEKQHGLKPVPVRHLKKLEQIAAL